MNKLGKSDIKFILLIPFILLATLIVVDTLISYSENKSRGNLGTQTGWFAYKKEKK